jgi:putative PIN family toxin of toxin-antitoxin system
MQLVLDTNVWIDWLVFEDPSIAPLKGAHQRGRIHIVVNESCLEELNEVLAYPEFRLDDAQKKNHLAEVDRGTIRHDDQRPARPTALPRCSDPDDQKFLTLALDAGADWLLTRDKALLKIGRKKLEAAGFRIATPAQWTMVFNQIPLFGAAI